MIKQVSLIFRKESNKVLNGVPYGPTKTLPKYVNILSIYHLSRSDQIELGQIS